MPLWASLVPMVATALLAVSVVLPVGAVLATICALALMGVVITAVHHAEVVAHRVGEPFGALVLAIAITIIEVALIVSMMVAGGPDKATLPRDTIFSAIMIICNGVVGICLLLGGVRHHEQSFHIEGANAALSTLIALTTLSLVLPTFTTSSTGPTYTGSQLAFAAVASLVLWSTFVFVQTVRHRDYFLPAPNTLDEASRARPPSNRLQTSLNLAFGSALASIGLTIPAVALVSVLIGMPLALGLEQKDLVLLVLTFVVASITLVSGRTHVMQGAVHLVIFAAFLFLAFVP